MKFLKSWYFNIKKKNSNFVIFKNIRDQTKTQAELDRINTDISGEDQVLGFCH